MVRRSIAGGDEVFRTRPNGFWDPHNLMYSWYRIPSPGVTWPERGFGHSTPFRAFMSCSRVNFTFYRILHWADRGSQPVQAVEIFINEEPVQRMLKSDVDESLDRCCYNWDGRAVNHVGHHSVHIWKCAWNIRKESRKGNVTEEESVNPN